MAQLNLFPLKSIVSPKWYIFKTLEIGKVHERLPLKELGECLPDQNENGKGAPRWLSNEGMFAMMFLKH